MDTHMHTCIHIYSSTSQSTTSNFVGPLRENVGRDFILTQDQNKISMMAL